MNPFAAATTKLARFVSAQGQGSMSAWTSVNATNETRPRSREDIRCRSQFRLIDFNLTRVIMENIFSGRPALFGQGFNPYPEDFDKTAFRNNCKHAGKAFAQVASSKNSVTAFADCLNDTKALSASKFVYEAEFSRDLMSSMLTAYLKLPDPAQKKFFNELREFFLTLPQPRLIHSSGTKVVQLFVESMKFSDEVRRVDEFYLGLEIFRGMHNWSDMVNAIPLLPECERKNAYDLVFKSVQSVANDCWGFAVAIDSLPEHERVDCYRALCKKILDSATKANSVNYQDSEESKVTLGNMNRTLGELIQKLPEHERLSIFYHTCEITIDSRQRLDFGIMNIGHLPASERYYAYTHLLGGAQSKGGNPFYPNERMQADPLIESYWLLQQLQFVPEQQQFDALERFLARVSIDDSYHCEGSPSVCGMGPCEYIASIISSCTDGEKRHKLCVDVARQANGKLWGLVGFIEHFAALLNPPQVRDILLGKSCSEKSVLCTSLMNGHGLPDSQLFEKAKLGSDGLRQVLEEPLAEKSALVRSLRSNQEEQASSYAKLVISIQQNPATKLAKNDASVLLGKLESFWKDNFRETVHKETHEAFKQAIASLKSY